MLVYLFSAWITLASFDTYVTIKTIKEYGIEAELNPLIQKLCTWWGPVRGTLVGILIPTLAIAALCWIFQASLILALLVGIRAALAYAQVVRFLNAD